MPFVESTLAWSATTGSPLIGTNRGLGVLNVTFTPSPIAAPGDSFRLIPSIALLQLPLLRLLRCPD
jgi:hypothetical protein